MPYSFVYDLNKISQTTVNKILEASYKTGVTKLLSTNAIKLVELFKIDQLTGLNLAEAITLVEDFIEVQNANNLQRENFEKAKNKHCLFHIVFVSIWIENVWQISILKFQVIHAMLATKSVWLIK